MKAEGVPVVKLDSLGVVGASQDGLKHYMFCGECERRLGHAENYLSYLVRGSANDLAAQRVDLARRGELTQLMGVDTELFSRAVAGFALKLHLSPATRNARFRLPERAVNDVKRAILSDVYAVNKFVFFAIKYVNRVIPDANVRARGHLSFKRTDGGVLMWAILGGWQCGLFVGPAHQWRAAWSRAALPDLELNQTVWTVPVFEAVATDAMLGITGVNADDLTPVRELMPSDACPCGLGPEFAACCSGRWLPERDYWYELKPKTPTSSRAIPHAS